MALGQNIHNVKTHVVAGVLILTARIAQANDNINSASV